jgi:hypothetical protein
MQARDRLPVYPDLAGKVAVVTGGSGGWWPIDRRFRDGRTETWWGAPLPIGRRGLEEQVAFDWKSANQLTSLADTRPRMWVLDGTSLHSSHGSSFQAPVIVWSVTGSAYSPHPRSSTGDRCSRSSYGRLLRA